MHECPTKVTSRGRETLIVVGALAALLAIYAPIYLPYLPNGKGGLGSDYSLWLPDLLAGYFWYLKNGLWALPWYSPSQCGGIPFYADPQVPYLSVPQFLTFVMPPVEAVQTSFLLFAAAGFLGAFRLARSNFELSLPAALLAGTMFMPGIMGCRRLLRSKSFLVLSFKKELLPSLP
jgi:hypothetical protein